MKSNFVYMLALSAAILVGSAAYFSVTGFAKLFSGAFTSIVILISGLEFAKLVVTSFLYRYWGTLSKTFKAYLLMAVFVLMVITSAGIYGFLSSAYSVTSDKMEKLDGNINIYEKKKEIMFEQVDRLKKNIENRNKRSESLTLLRINQESRIDTLYKKGMTSSARKTEQIIKDANNEIVNIGHINDSLNKVIQVVSDSVGRIDMEILNLKSSDVKGDIGPLKYIATLTHKTVDSVVNFFILLLVFISDPLAVCLVIATNKVMLEQNQIVEEEKKQSRLVAEVKEYLNKIKSIKLW